MEKSIVVSVHESYRPVVAVCDAELVGRKLEEGIRALDLSGPFFEGTHKSADEARAMVVQANRDDATFNFVGERSVNIAKSLGLVSESGAIEIDGVPFALVLL